MPRLPESITVAELIEALQDADPEAHVVFASNYGDIGKTQQVHFLHGTLELEPLEQSAYSDSGWAVADQNDYDDGDDGEAEDKRPTMLVLS